MGCFFKGFVTSLAVISSLLASEVKDSWKGDEYAKNSESQKSSAEDFIGALHLDDFSIVLDVGCGDGKITAAIANLVPHGEVVGVDISPSMIRFANQAFSNVANLSFDIQDAAQINYTEKFNLITSFTVMQWVLPQAQALNAMHKALKPGGTLCIQMPTGLPEAMQGALSKLIFSDQWAKYFVGFSAPWKFYQPEEYKELLLNANFVPSRIETSTKHEKFPSREVFQGFLRQWFPYLRPLPEDLKDIFLTKLVDEYLKALPVDQAGRVSFIVTRLEVEAKK